MQIDNIREESKEIRRAIQDGYNACFNFIEGLLWSDQDQNVSYPIKDVQKIPVPDPESHIVVYRIETPDGIRGYAVTDWEDNP